MFEIFGKTYYIDIDSLIEECRPDYPRKKTDKKTKVEKIDEEDGLSLNIFKFESFKSCVERILSEYNNDDDDDKLIMVNDTSLSPSFKIAFNTLLKYKILKEIYE
jgi:hypothetical protein